MVTLEGLDLNLLLTLHLVAETESVTRAAAAMHVTPAAVSNALGRLRGLLGDPLVVRRGRGITLTPRARELAPQLARAVGALREAVEGGFDPARCTRRFTLASADNLSPEVFPRFMRRFAVELPRASLRLVSLDLAVSADGLASGEVDVLLGIPPATPEVRTAPAYDEALVCVAHAPSVRGRALSLADFLARRHVAVVLQAKYPIDLVDAALAARGLHRDVALSVPHFTTAAACLVGTPYLAMLPERMAAQLRRSFELKAFPSPVPLPRGEVRLAWHARSDADEPSRFFRALLQRALR